MSRARISPVSPTYIQVFELKSEYTPELAGASARIVGLVKELPGCPDPIIPCLQAGQPFRRKLRQVVRLGEPLFDPSV